MSQICILLRNLLFLDQVSTPEFIKSCLEKALNIISHIEYILYIILSRFQYILIQLSCGDSFSNQKFPNKEIWVYQDHVNARSSVQVLKDQFGVDTLQSLLQILTHYNPYYRSWHITILSTDLDTLQILTPDLDTFQSLLQDLDTFQSFSRSWYISIRTPDLNTLQSLLHPDHDTFKSFLQILIHFNSYSRSWHISILNVMVHHFIKIGGCLDRH